MTRSYSFKAFIERMASEDFLDVLQTQFGITPENLAKIPQVASFIGIENDVWNQTPYQITGIDRNNEGDVSAVRVKIIDDPSFKTRQQYVNKGGEMMRVDSDDQDTGSSDGKEHSIPINDILKWLNQDKDPAQQQQPGGMPGPGAPPPPPGPPQ